jgi:hypothetical protein
MDGIQQGIQQGYPGVTGAYAPQLAPQGFFGSLLGAPLGGVIGSGIGGLFGNSNIGRQIGQLGGGIGGSLLPFTADPVTNAWVQQQQLAQQAQLVPQGFFGNLLGAIGQPLGGAVGGLFGNQHLGGQIGSGIGQFGRLLPFTADPVMNAYLQQAAQQQAQLAPQGFFGNLLGAIGQPLGGAVGGLFGNQHLGGQIGVGIGQLGRLLPFTADPVMNAYLQQVAQQQAQLAPQGFFGNLLGSIGQPLGGAIGGLFGNQHLGGQIGGGIGQFGRLLPFQNGPMNVMPQYPTYPQAAWC